VCVCVCVGAASLCRLPSAGVLLPRRQSDPRSHPSPDVVTLLEILARSLLPRITPPSPLPTPDEKSRCILPNSPEDVGAALPSYSLSAPRARIKYILLYPPSRRMHLICAPCVNCAHLIEPPSHSSSFNSHGDLKAQPAFQK